MFKLDLEKAEEPEIKLPTSAGPLKKREFQKNIYFCFIDYAKAFDCVDHNKLWKILKEMGIPDHLICLLRNLYAGQEATATTGHGTRDWFQIGKGVHQVLSPGLFNLYAEYIRRRQWQPIPVLLPGKSHGRRSLVGCSLCGHEELDTTERLHFHFSLFTFMHWRRKWQPTPVFLPGESQGRGEPGGVPQSQTWLKRLSSSSSSSIVHQEKCWIEWSTSWNQHCWQKYQ